MTDQEAIDRVQRELDTLQGMWPKHSYWRFCLSRVFNLAVKSLREQEERENPKQLTIEELRKMNGEPVWVEELSGLVDQTGWALVEVDDRGYYKDIPFVRCHICQWNVISRKLHCYRHKPPKGE